MYVHLKIANVTRVLFFARRFRSWKKSYQVEQWLTATVPVLHELSRGQSL